MNIETFETETDWLARRAQLITATDVAAICELSPYRSALDVYLSKQPDAPSMPDSAAMKRGRRAERFIADDYAEREGVVLPEPPARYWLAVHPTIPWLSASPDRIVSATKGLEVKTARTADGWADPDEDPTGVPEAYIVQCALCMAVTGLPEWDLAACIRSFDDFRIYRLQRNVALEEALIARAAEFRDRHLLPGIAPPFDGSPTGDALLKLLYPADARPELLRADEAASADLAALVRDRALLDAAETVAETSAQRVKDRIGDCAGIDSGSVRVTWKRSKDRDATDWQAVAADLARELGEHVGVPDAQRRAQASVARNTVTKPGPRVFRVTAK